MSSLLDMLNGVADVVSTPGQLARGALAGRPGDMLSGYELLSSWGLDPGDGVGGTLAGVGADVATDPLTYAGGALAKALLGGKFSPVKTSLSGGRLGAERDVFDLMPNWEANAGRIPARTVHYAEDVTDPLEEWLNTVPEADRAMAESAVREARAGGDWLERGPIRMGRAKPTKGGLPKFPDKNPDAVELPTLDTSPIDALPPPDSYGPAIGYGPDPVSWSDPPPFDPSHHGIPGDLTREGRLADALRVRLSGVNDVLFDASRLTEQGRHGLNLSMGPHNTEWLQVLRNHARELSAMENLAEALTPEAQALLPQIRQQNGQLWGLIGDIPGNGNTNVPYTLMRDLNRGMVDPAELRELYGEGIRHLPFDDAALRRLAANEQITAGGNYLSRLVNDLGSYLPGGLLPEGAGQSPESTIRALQHISLDPSTARRLDDVLSPYNLRQRIGINQGIAERLLAEPPPEVAPLLAEWQNLVRRMVAQPPGG